MTLSSSGHWESYYMRQIHYIKIKINTLLCTYFIVHKNIFQLETYILRFRMIGGYEYGICGISFKVQHA